MENFNDGIEWDNENMSIIKVIGVGGGGCNAVNYMYKQGIHGAGFMVCNTDEQALRSNAVPFKVQLGKKLTNGLGAGSIPARGKQAAEESLGEVEKVLKDGNTKMLFVTVGMGGGTGTGAAPVIAKVARDLGILTIGVATIPFASFEPQRISIAREGIKEFRKHVDSIMVINNEEILNLYGDLDRHEAFAKANEVLCTAVKSIVEIITVPGQMNVDFADVETAMRNQGVAFIGMGKAQGDNRIMEVVKQAVNSPLLNNNSISGAKHLLINIMDSAQKPLKASELRAINTLIFEAAGSLPNSKTGVGTNEQLADDEVTVSLIATGFDLDDIDNPRPPQPPKGPDDGGGGGGGGEIIDLDGVDFDGHAPYAPKEDEPDDASDATPPAKKPGVFKKLWNSADGSAATATATLARPKKAHARAAAVPRWLNPELSFEELDRPPVMSAAPREEPKARQVLSRLNGRWELSPVAYMANNPD